MRTLFITDEYLPVPSSNGACVSKLVNSFTNGNQAYVLSVTKNTYESTESVKYAAYKRRPASIKNRIFGYCQDDGFVKEIYTHASDLIRQKNIDSVVCLCRPVEPLIAGIQLKKKFPNIKLYGYFLDNLLECELNNRIKTRIVNFNYKRLFLQFYKYAEKVIVLKYYKKTFSQIFKESSKLVYVGLPSISAPASCHTDRNENIRIVYTGSLCKGYREPEKVLDVLGTVLKDHHNIDIVFFSRGCEEQLEAAKKTLGEHLVINGLVSFEQAQRQIASADVLLNIANDLLYAVPGKLFEYFSTGKPILNYCFREDDPANEEYKKYPRIFNLYSYKDNDVSACTYFLLDRDRADIPFDEIRQLYADSTPEFTVNEIIGQDAKGERNV